MRKLFILSLLAMMIAIGGCGGGGTSADPLGTDSITFADAAGSGAVSINGALTLKATVKNAAGAAVMGREVSFGFVSKGSGTGATLASTSANTNGAGEATILYRAGATAGYDVVRAYLSNGTYADVNITVGSPTAGERQVTVTATPAALIAGQTSVIVAQVNNADGTVASGLAVTFQFLGGVAAPSGGSLTVVSATTDASGMAYATYTAGGNSSTLSVQDVVEAKVTGSTGAAVTITRRPGTATGGVTVTVTTSSASLSAGSQSIITATVLNADGTPAAGQTVTFTASTSNSGAANPTPGSSATNADGMAFATYTAGNNSLGSIVYDVVTASVAGVASGVIITRTASTAGTYAVSISPSSASVTAGQVSIITATVTGGSTAAGITVYFTLPVNGSGATLSAPSATTDNSGKAVVIYQPGPNTATINVQDAVQAAVGTATSAVAITRTGSSTSAFSITVSASPATLTLVNANSVIAAKVMNNAGTAISSVSVTFTVTGGGTLPAPETATTDGSGNAVIIFTGGPAGRLTGETDVVTASITVGGNTYTNAVVITYP
jgi:hypothetical protein